MFGPRTPSKYGGSAPFPRMGAASFVKIPYDQPTWFSDAELDKTWAEMQKGKKMGMLEEPKQ